MQNKTPIAALAAWDAPQGVSPMKRLKMNFNFNIIGKLWLILIMKNSLVL
jgi:hypothetical protein